MLYTFTASRLKKKIKNGIVALALAAAIAPAANSQVLYSESFNTVSPLPTGWSQQNLSNPLGAGVWAQGSAAVFPAYSGAPNAFIRASFGSTTGAGEISNWLFMPSVTVKNGDQLTFFTRKATPAPDDFPDRLQVRLSINGASVNAGTTSGGVGDFTNLLLDINPTLVAGGYPLTWTQYTVTIVGVPAPITGRLAFRYFVTDGGPTGNNSDYIGIDEVAYTAFTGPCAGAPAPGNTVSTPAAVCPGLGFTLSLASTPTTSGITYQWQSASSGAGPWTDISGATASTLTTSQITATWYRCNVTCNAGPATTASNPVQVNMNPPTSCYCLPASNSDCSFDDVINNVTLQGLNNTTNCSANGYGNFTSSVPPGILFIGAANPMQVTVGPGGTEYVGVWVDFDKSGTFEPGEFTALGSGNGVTISNSISIPAGSPTGTTRMRVRVRWNTALTSANSCTGYGFGETEDYSVTLAPCVGASVVTQPVNTSTACGSNAVVTISAAGSLLTYQWQEKTSAAAAWANLSNSGVYSGVTTASLTLTNVPATMSGYQYRVIYSGGCSSPDFSGAATLTVTPLIATTNISSAAICTGTIVPLTLTNASAPTTVSFTNNTVLPIPDGSAAGVMSSVTVSGIPAGAAISDITVIINDLEHPYVGDLDINLIAPNNQNINLVGGLNNGSGSNSTDNFLNTAISSNGTVALSGAPAPRTGTFAADRLAGYGPTGNTQTTSSWAALTTTMNGTWKLALADFFTPDPGTLKSWTLRITYGFPTAGVWTASPAAPNTLFTNPAATVQYVTGSQVTTVYVKPTVNTTYSVVYTNSTPCISPATNIAISVSNPVTSVVNPANASTCINGGASFTVSAAGNPLSYQWEESTNGGSTWAAITGATSATLSVSGVTLAMNNYRYRCVITAAPCGSVTTTGAILTVNPLPIVTVASPVTTLLPGRTTVITAAAPAGSVYSWTRNGEIVLGATSNTITVNVDQTGSYRAIINVTGCSNTSNEILINSEVSDRLWIYPNPTADGNFQIRLYNSSGIVGEVRTVSIFSTAGQMIAQKEFIMVQSLGSYQRMDFGLTNLAAGTYVVKVHSKQSGKVVSGFLIAGK